MSFSRLSLAGCFFGACAACLSALPASAQVSAPIKPAVPAAAGMTPVQGASAALDHLHQAKSLAEMNPFLTNESAAVLGFTLVLADSLMSGMATALSPKAASSPAAASQAASEKAFQNQVEALLNRFSLSDKTLKMSNSDSLPPALVARGHQFLVDAFALSNSYEKSHTSANDRASGKNPTIGSQIKGSDFPASSQCSFKVLSPTRVQIVPRSKPTSSFEARLEDGQWRIDMLGLTNSAELSKPGPKTLTPQEAAFLKAIDDNDAAAVGRELKADPALANLPPSFDKGNSGTVSDPPLFEAAFHDDMQVITLLLQAGAKVNAETESRETALDQAAFFGGKKEVALLLAHGANVAHRDDFGRTALNRAIEGDNADAVALLLAHGANANVRDEEGKTPLAQALDPSNHGFNRAAIVKLLRQHGAKK